MTNTTASGPIANDTAVSVLITLGFRLAFEPVDGPYAELRLGAEFVSDNELVQVVIEDESCFTLAINRREPSYRGGSYLIESGSVRLNNLTPDQFVIAVEAVLNSTRGGA